MPFIRRKRSWELSPPRATPQHVYLNRRSFIAAVGAGAITAAMPFGCDSASTVQAQDLPQSRTAFYPAKRNEQYRLDRAITDQAFAGKYNNFYEFGTDKADPARRSGKFNTVPWTIEVDGLVKQPRRIDLDDLLPRMPIEERLYRFRCVEAWAMAVPWTGFPLKALIDHVEPLSSAKFVRFVTVNRPEEMPGIKEQHWYPWPYFEGLRMDEATNELALLAVGIYGKPMPNQHGAPIRLVVPWKYGYKSIKSIEKIEFVEEQPSTFWSELQPTEYPFESNVNPQVPHPRWSQATERLIDTGERVPTQMYNGYAEQVAHLY
jgi:methionine sulfoxide reductase catalytic subunit